MLFFGQYTPVIACRLAPSELLQLVSVSGYTFSSKHDETKSWALIKVCK